MHACTLQRMECHWDEESGPQAAQHSKSNPGRGRTLWPDFEVTPGLAGDVLDLEIGAVGVICHSVKHRLLPLQLVIHLLQQSKRGTPSAISIYMVLSRPPGLPNPTLSSQETARRVRQLLEAS